MTFQMAPDTPDVPSLDAFGPSTSAEAKRPATDLSEPVSDLQQRQVGEPSTNDSSQSFNDSTSLKKDIYTKQRLGEEDSAGGIGSDPKDPKGSHNDPDYVGSEIIPVTDVAAQIEVYRTVPDRNRNPQVGKNAGLLDLHAALSAAMVEIRISEERRAFLPSNKLYELICENSVFQELKRARPSFFGRRRSRWSDERLRADARKICSEDTGSQTPPTAFKKIFAILVLMERPLEIREFFTEVVCDSDLPLNKVEVKKSSRRIRPKLCRRGGIEIGLTCFRNLKPRQIMRFEELQWSMVSPFMKQAGHKKLFHYVFGEDMILPFTHWEEHEDPGASGQVHKVRIHDSHHNFPPPHPEDPYYAVKQLYSGKKEAFDREVQVLVRLSDTHKHLVTLLGTYEQHEKFHLILPWAQGDLLSFWRKCKPHPEVNVSTVRWMAKQCMGVAQGLSTIHRYQTTSNSTLVGSSKPKGKTTPSSSTLAHPLALKASQSSNLRYLFGRHGDIKPENILWFEDTNSSLSAGNTVTGTLKISDFGVCEFTKDDGSLQRVPNSPTYRPPEVDLHQQISTAYDIWALGAVFLEFVTWCLGGWEYVEKFRHQRCLRDQYSELGYDTMGTDVFFIIVRQGTSQRAEVKQQVTDFIQELHQHGKCTEYFHDFLDLIKTRMLIIQPPESSITQPPESKNSDFGKKEDGRISCGNLFRKLSEFYHKCKNDEGYATTPTPRSTRVASQLD